MVFDFRQVNEQMIQSAIKKPIVVIGIGEMSGVFTRGLLKAGYPLYPVTRDMNIQAVSEQLNDPEMVLVAVGENDLAPVLEQLSEHWKDRLCLLQNELLPRDWQAHKINNPSVISVWFEKKKGQDFKVLVPSPVTGPKAELIKNALAQLEIPCWRVKNEQEMLFELVRKNLYILTTNIAGLDMAPGCDVNELWDEHRDLALRIIADVLTIQAHLTSQNFDDSDRERLIEAMVEAINGDLGHKCMGRSAPARLARAVNYAKANNLEVKELTRIAEEQLEAEI